MNAECSRSFRRTFDMCVGRIYHSSQLSSVGKRAGCRTISNRRSGGIQLGRELSGAIEAGVEPIQGDTSRSEYALNLVVRESSGIMDARSSDKPNTLVRVATSTTKQWCYIDS